MANEANLIFERTFDGALDDPWPGFSFGSGNPPFSKPRLDGKGKGIGSVQQGVGPWRGRSSAYPGRPNYKADLSAKWKNAGFSGERGVGLIVRMKAFDECLIARLTSKGTANPTLELVLVKPTGEQILGTYSGAGLGASYLNAGAAWRCRVEDLNDGSGESEVKLFTAPNGAISDGTLRVTWQGPLGSLRGNFTTGVEITLHAWNDDVRVDDLSVYDFADEWVAPAPSAGGNGWQVAIDGTTYDVTDEDDDAAHPGSVGRLEGLDPPIYLETVKMGYGPGGNGATLSTSGFTGGILGPWSEVVVFYDGEEYFAGRVTSGRQTGSAGEQRQTWTCKDAFWLARNVLLEEDDCTGVLHYNVADKSADEYRAERSGLTLGQVVADLFAKFTEGDGGLRFHGAAPPTGAAFVATELDLLSAKKHELALSNNFATAIEQIRAIMPYVQVWIDPRDKVWHFRDVRDLDEEPIVFDSEWASVEVEPQPETAYTRIRYRGVKKATKDSSELEYGTASRGLPPAWTDAQEANGGGGGSKRSAYGAKGTILSAQVSSNNPAFPGYDAGAPKERNGQPITVLVSIDVPASLGIDPDDLVGGILSVSGDAYTRFVVGNSSTRIWAAAPLWGGGSPPPPGSTFVVSAKVEDGAIPALMANGVGRAFFLPPVSICGGSKYGGGIKNGGICGTARVDFGDGAKTYSDEYKAKVHFSSAMQSAGFCSPVVELSERPLPPIGLVNYLPPAGSMPKSWCEGGASPAGMPQVTVAFKASEHEDDAPCFYYPEDESFAGDAFTEWGISRTFPFDDEGFTDQDQKDDLLPAAIALHAVLSGKTYVLSVKLGTPWKNAVGIIRPPPSSVARWFALGKAISFSSSRRSMPAFESPNAYPVFEVVYSIRDRSTTLRAGTASGWLGLDARTLTRQIRKDAVEKKIAAAIQTLEDYRNRLNDKAMKVERSMPAPTDACDVTQIDTSEKRVVSVQKKFDDDQKTLSSVGGIAQAVNDLLLGEESVIPGDPDLLPGDSAGFVVDGGPVLGGAVGSKIPFAGPRDDVVNADHGKYGGATGVDSPTWGGPSSRLFRRGPLGFRMKTNASGQPVGIEAALVDADGSFPATGFVEITKPRDIPDLLNVAVETIPGGESLVGRLISRTNELNAAIGRIRQPDETLAAPGEPMQDDPTKTAPPDLFSLTQVQALLSGLFRPVPNTADDAGGQVYEGPLSPNGAGGVGRFFRVMVPENELVEVQPVAAGTGTNGGDYDWLWPHYYIASAAVIHKNARPNEARSSTLWPNPVELPGEFETNHPFGNGELSAEFSDVGQSAFVFDLDMPDGVFGFPLFSVHVGEDPNVIAAPGTVYDFAVDYAYQASPWGGVAPAGSPSLTTDGSGTTQGRYLYPGGSVPPGLRRVSGSVALGGGSGLGSGSRARVHGFGVEVIVVEGGFLGRISEGMTIAEESSVVQGSLEGLELGIDVAVEPQVVREEGLDLHVGCSYELNPVGEGDEGLDLGIEVSTTCPVATEGLKIGIGVEYAIL